MRKLMRRIDKHTSAIVGLWMGNVAMNYDVYRESEPDVVRRCPKAWRPHECTHWPCRANLPDAEPVLSTLRSLLYSSFTQSSIDTPRAHPCVNSP